MSTTTATRQADPFFEWLESPFVRVAGFRKHGQWYAVAEDYNIAGMGPTEEAAYRDVAVLVEAYLRSCYRQGLTYKDSWRRVSRIKKLLYALRSTLARALRDRAPAPLAEEGRFLLPLNGTRG
jgi:hypothetical protein